MDPIATYIVRCIRHNNEMEEAELARAEMEAKTKKPLWRSVLSLIIALTHR